MRSLSMVKICSSSTTDGRLNAGFCSMRTWVGWFGFLETFEVSSYDHSRRKFISCIILNHNNRTFTSLLRTIVRVKVCKVDLAPAKAEILCYINGSNHPPFPYVGKSRPVDGICGVLELFP